ncbi:hypothetical protein [Sphingosinicella soli]|uniref:Uncharacterized protein n=1 Tax=Sphingosinicella soli TaxID=333708 RepID=A0A7W7B4E0_9SPHN|nr:hypothetical protein [Sphingosinicella soli]MBB4633777.1 hypothetical protein [Sphingosinicella soli]
MNAESIGDVRAKLTTATELEGLPGAISALDAAYSFLLDCGASYSELRPLFGLLAALEDHKRGKPNPLLAVHSKRGNRSHVADDQFKACAAATMTIIQKSGRTKREAASLVSGRLKSAGIAISPTNIDTWHREISSHRHADPGVLGTYQLLIEKAGSADEISAEAALRTLVNLARTKL